MKLRYLIPSLLAVVTLFFSCSDDNDPTYLDEIRVSESFVSINVDGGSSTITLTTTADWAFENIFKQTVKADDGSTTTTYTALPAWLKVSQLSGPAGTTQLTFSAEKALDGRTTQLRIQCAGKTQIIEVIQGLPTVSNATCKVVIDGPDRKTYRVTGTCTSIANTTYGNWYLTDETGQIYIYGTLDKKGQEKNFLSLGIEVGDVVTVEGPKTTYNSTVELVNVTVVNIQKSLVKVDSLSVKDGVLPLEGGEIIAYLSCKGNGVSVDIPEDAKDWLAITSINSGASPTVTFRAAPNTGGERSTTVVFKTTDGKKTYTSETTITQKGAILEVPVADFLAAEVGPTQYRLTGVVTGVYSSDKQGESFYIRDYSGETLVYRVNSFKNSGAKVGDVVTVVGQRGEYKETPQLVSGTFEKIDHVVTEVSIAEFLTKPDDNSVYYMVSGTIDEIANPTYGNVWIKDGDNRLYVYGCYPGWGATGDARKGLFEKLGIQVGNKLTVIGVKGSYNGQTQVANGIYFSHE